MRLLAALLIIPALLLAAAGVAAFVAEAKALASEAQPELETTERALADAAEAVRLQPWNAAYRNVFAEVLQRAGQFDAARPQLEQALRLGPADATEWLRLELLLAQTSPASPTTLDAARGAQRLGPNERDVQAAQADLAVRMWPLAPPTLQALWLDSIRFTLRHDARGFLVRTFLSAGEENLCQLEDSLKLKDWCKRAQAVRVSCLRNDLNAGQQRWCQSMGVEIAPVNRP